LKTDHNQINSKTHKKTTWTKLDVSMANPRSGTSQNHRSRRISYVST
jgi:hypothetical protein